MDSRLNMGSLFKRFPKITLLVVNLLFIILLVLIAELILKKYVPFNIATIGHKFCDNAKLYGWGYSPHERIKNFDPDTGETFTGFINNHGWRDIDREYENKNKTYRIVILGDSMTFGVLVPMEKSYTRILEKKLLDQGYKVEVINIAYAGWGTDQELEALKNEGIKYKPNLIINQFCMNDPGENTYFEDGSAEQKTTKPFYYEIDDHNTLTRKINPYFTLESHSLKDKIIHHSEILKRIWAVYLNYRFRSLSSKAKYQVAEDKLVELETVLNLSKDSQLYTYLKSQIGKRINVSELISQIEQSGVYRIQKENILRILEVKLVSSVWVKESFYPKYVDKNDYKWRLYVALIDQMKKQADQIGAPLVIFPELEEGSYEWSKFWYVVSDDPVSKTNYLSPRELIKSMAKIKGIDVIDNTILYKRARNDGHPNVQGNQAMAEDIWKYLMNNKKNELEKYRISIEAH